MKSAVSTYPFECMKVSTSQLNIRIAVNAFCWSILSKTAARLRISGQLLLNSSKCFFGQESKPQVRICVLKFVRMCMKLKVRNSN